MEIESVTSARAPDAGDMLSLLRSGDAHLRQHSFAQARADYERVLTLDPGQPQAHLQLGRLSQREGRHDDAEQHYRAALQALSTFGEACLHLGRLLEASSRHDEASATYERCIATDTNPQRIAQARAARARLAQQPHRSCRQCGRFTTLGDFRGHGSGKANLCPRCYGEHHLKKARRNIWAVVGMLVLTSICVSTSLLAQSLNPLFTIVSLWLAIPITYVMIPLHELAHATMAWLLGGKVFEIRIGAGKTLWQRTWRGVKVSLGPYPIGGHSVAAFPTRRAIRLRVALYTFAGLALSALILAACMPLRDPQRSLWTVDLVESLIFANISVLVLNLLPLRLAQGMRIMETDGRKLIKLLLGKLTAEQCHSQYYLTEATYAFHDADYARLLTHCEAGLARYPDDPQLQNLLAIANLETGRFAQAASIFRRELEALDTNAEEPSGMTPEQRLTLRAILLNNLALALMLDHSLPESERAPFLELAENAYGMLPWQPAIEATWGAALIEIGRPELGLAYLKTASNPDESDRDRGNNLAFIAWAHHQLGQAQESATALEQAHRLAPDSTMVRHVAAHLQSPFPPPELAALPQA